MTLGIEEQFAANLISMFWGSDLFVGLVAIGFFFGLLAMTRIPIQLVAPLYATALVITMIAIPQIAVVLIFVIAIVFATFMYSLVER